MNRIRNRVGGHFDEDDARGRLADHVIIQSSRGLSETWWLIQSDGGWQDSACLTFTPRCGITITGDLLFGDNRSVTAIGYDRDWFVSRLGADYLCSKFLRQEWRNEIAERTGKQIVCESRRARDLDREKARAVWDACDQCDDMMPYEFGNAWMEAFGDRPEFGEGYNARDAENLIAVQHRFRQRWWELHETNSAEVAA